MNKLLSCPFCDGEIKIRTKSNHMSFGECENRCFYTPFYQDPRTSMEMVNTRKPMERIVEQLEDKREEILHKSEFDNYTINYFLEYVDDLIEIVVKGGVDNG